MPSFLRCNWMTLVWSLMLALVALFVGLFYTHGDKMVRWGVVGVFSAWAVINLIYVRKRVNGQCDISRPRKQY